MPTKRLDSPLKTSKPPKMVHIAEITSPVALCGHRCTEDYPGPVTDNVDCVVCVDLYRGLSR